MLYQLNLLIGHGQKWNLITSGDYAYYELSGEITSELTPNDLNHCLTPEIGKSYDKDLLLEIDEIYTRPEEPSIEEPEIDPISAWINPLTLTAQENNVTINISGVDLNAMRIRFLQTI